jgi:hypothetical protein
MLEELTDQAGSHQDVPPLKNELASFCFRLFTSLSHIMKWNQQLKSEFNAPTKFGVP